MSGQETGGQELRERIAERVALWLVAYPISSWNLCGGDPDRERTLGKTWGDGIADDLLPLVQPQLDAKDARIAGFEAEAKRAELADALALEHAQAADRDIKALIARAEAAEAKLAEAGYGTHQCVRCGQPQAQEDDTCPPCDGEIYREEILELRDEIKRLTEDGEAGAKHIVEQAAENQRLRAELDTKDAQIADLTDKNQQAVNIGRDLVVLEARARWRAERYRLAWTSARQRARSMTQNAQDWCETAKLTEAERDRLREAVDHWLPVLDGQIAGVETIRPAVGGTMRRAFDKFRAALDQETTEEP